MNILLSLVGLAFAIAGLICWLIVVIDAFKDSVLKGLGTLFCCGLYWLYYALFEFEHENKWVIVLVAIFGNSIAGGIYRMSYLG